jgi:hypothetical protein
MRTGTLLMQPLARAAKTSYTAGTLCAIAPKIGWKYYMKNYV